MRINLKIEKPTLSPWQFTHCTVQLLAVSGIKMQELKLHKFWDSHIFSHVGDMLIANLVSLSAADYPSNEYVIEKGLGWPEFDLQPAKTVEQNMLGITYKDRKTNK